MLKAPRSILEKQRRVVIVSGGVNPGPCFMGAHHEHRCVLCGRTTTGIGDSFCPAVHKEKAIQDYWDKQLKSMYRELSKQSVSEGEKVLDKLFKHN